MKESLPKLDPENLNVIVSHGIILRKIFKLKGLNNVDAVLAEYDTEKMNFKILNNKPLFKSYPSYVNDEYINYIQAGGILERGENDYILLTPVVFGAHTKRVIYYATSKDLENWSFQKQKILSTEQIPFAKKEGNVFSTGNPMPLKKNRFLVLLGVEQPNGNYTCAYMIIDNQLKIIQPPQEIKIPNWYGTTQNSFPLSIIKHKTTYRILLHRRAKQSLETEVYEITTKNLFKTLTSGEKIITSRNIQNAKRDKGYLRGKADDASYIKFNSELYILLGSEEMSSQYVTSINREYGLLKLENNKWIHDNRSPLIINPINIHHKYPEYEWATDHLGGFISTIFKDNYLHLFLTFGTDNPDYLISGIKVKVKD